MNYNETDTCIDIRKTYLSGKNMLYFTGPNTKRQGPKGPMRGRMRVSTDGNTARKRESLFGTDDMNNALTFIRHTKVLETKVLDIRLELHDLSSRGCFFNKSLNIDKLRTILRGDIVIDRGERTVGPSNTATSEAKTFKGLWTGNFVN